MAMSGVWPKIETQYAIIEAFDRGARGLCGNPKVATRTFLYSEAIISSLCHELLALSCRRELTSSCHRSLDQLGSAGEQRQRDFET